MLDKLFIEILNMSYMASIVILTILCIRIFLKNAPKKYIYILWLIPLVRLVLPFSFESIFSLIPVNPKPIPADIREATLPKIAREVSNVDYSVNNILPVPEALPSVNPLQIMLSIGALIWVTVMIGLLIYGMRSYIKLKRQLLGAILIADNVYSSSNISSPFVIGIIKPKIYLPNTLIESERAYILLHEQTHIKRFDPFFRLIGFVVLCLHWFNPLVWIAYYVSGKDMEMSCDESVITKLGGNIKKEYAQSLLNFTTKRTGFSMSPLAFGEGDTKGRIKNILKFQKPKTYFIILVVVVLAIASIGLLANPIKNKFESSINGNVYGVVNILFDSPMYSFSYSEETAPSFTISSDYTLYSKEGESDQLIAGLYETDIKKEEVMGWIHFTERLDAKAINVFDAENIVYRADTNNKNGVFYLVIETKEHETLVLYGYDKGEDVSIRWVFEVEPLKKLEIFLSSKQLWDNRTEYVGDNSSVANICSQLQLPDYLEYQGISLQTENQPFGLTIMLDEKDGNIETSLDENPNILFELNASILFSLVRNLDEITFSVDGKTIKSKPSMYTRAWAEERIGIDLWDASRDEEAFDKLLMRIKDIVTEGIDRPIYTHILADEKL